jgi:hypothetical protein
MATTIPGMAITVPGGHLKVVAFTSESVREPQEMRAHAAALENQAEALGRDGKYAEALAQLEAVQRLWPERSGLKELVKSAEGGTPSASASSRRLSPTTNSTSSGSMLTCWRASPSPSASPPTNCSASANGAMRPRQ